MSSLQQIDKEKKLNALALELYGEHRAFLPRYPWVFVRVLPKEMRTLSGLILPDTDANKTVYEGIVLSTWQPFTKEVGHEYEAVSTFATRINRLARKLYSGQSEQTEPIRVSKLIQMKSGHVPGDHVLFPHWAGLPVVGYTDKHYRIVKETSPNSVNEGEIIATVEYESANMAPRELVKQIIEKHWQNWVDDPKNVPSAIMAEIDQRFLLVDHDMGSVTLSGR